jgi:hypothetical protein
MTLVGSIKLLFMIIFHLVYRFSLYQSMAAAIPF